MEIENITGVCFSTRWSSKQKGHLSVSNGLFGEIIIDDEGMHAVISEEFTNGASRIWGQELKWCGIGGGSCNNGGVGHGSV